MAPVLWRLWLVGSVLWIAFWLWIGSMSGTPANHGIEAAFVPVLFTGALAKAIGWAWRGRRA